MKGTSHVVIVSPEGGCNPASGASDAATARALFQDGWATTKSFGLLSIHNRDRGFLPAPTSSKHRVVSYSWIAVLPSDLAYQEVHGMLTTQIFWTAIVPA